MSCVRGLLTLFLLAAACRAETTQISETAYFDCDLSKLKSGAWVEYADPDVPEVTTSRLACVKIEENVVWIEKTTGADSKEVILAGVSKASNLVLFAWAGQPGEKPRRLQIAESHAAKGTPGGASEKGPKVSPEEERKMTETQSGKCTVEEKRESVKVADKVVDCEKWTVVTKTGDRTHTETFWISDEVPFAKRLDKSGKPMIWSKDVPWEGKPTMNGGIAKRTSQTDGKTNTRIVRGFGADATPRLKTEEPPRNDEQEK